MARRIRARVKLVVATNNPGKLREIAAMLSGFDVVAQSTLGIGEADEPHDTFVENA
ncbi:MAG TPA: non-canonical purine NTP pyrophosphatase, partial [Burkholderiales bacterium]|nr:non-canonical purine NTP pyrophosphatase [Burkholderiales bacterium]